MANKTIVENLNGLKQPRRGTLSVVKKQPQRVLVSAAGIGKPTGGTNSVGISGSSLPNPLTEASIDSREYYKPVTIYSSDGIFSFNVTPIKSITLSGYKFVYQPDPSEAGEV